MSIRTALAASTFIAAAPLSASIAAPMLADASFESPALASNSYVYNPAGTGWSFSNAGVTSNGGPFYAGTAPDGVQTAFIQSNANMGTGSISQTVTGLTVGSGYVISFYLASRPGFPANPVDVTIGGTDLGAFTNTGTGFVLETTGIYTAKDTSAVLKFTGTNVTGTDNDVALDAVSITQSGLSVSVPEPATLALLAVGSVGVLIGRRRRA